MKFSRPHRGFTLVEVLLAAFILTILATGAIATTWRLAGFARLKASELAAQSFCTDVAMAYLETDLSSYYNTHKPTEGNPYHLVDEAGFFSRLDKNHPLYAWMPKFSAPDESTRNEDKVIPFYREGYMDPILKIDLDYTNAAPRVTVMMKWGVQNDESQQYVTTVQWVKSTVNRHRKESDRIAADDEAGE